jgi:hypothetical protein
MKRVIKVLADISISLYFVWVVIQLFLLLYFENTISYKENFWPFRPLHFENPQRSADGTITTISQIPISSYDITEFIFYILFPLFLAFTIMFIIRLLTKHKSYYNT